jgi:hypothetical protein
MFDKADLIHRYTRADAIRDGVLIDVSAVAREAGIRYPVALTRAVWQRCIAVPPGVLFQDEAGRLWDLLLKAIRKLTLAPQGLTAMGFPAPLVFQVLRGQRLSGKDSLLMLCCAITQQQGGRVVPFALHIRNGNRDRIPPLVRLKAVCGPGDDGSPCITVMLADED